MSAEVKSITTAIDQTLTCTIEGLSPSATATTVIWRDPEGNTVVDNEGYDLTQGTVDSHGSQIAVLTVKAAALASFIGKSSLTYKCSVRSGLFPDSPSSSYLDVVATILTLG